MNAVLRGVRDFVMERGQKLFKKIVTYFMDAPWYNLVFAASIANVVIDQYVLD